MNHTIPGSGSHSNTRFYLVLITLVVGGIFVVLLLNNNNKDSFSLTGSSVGLFDNNNTPATGEEDLVFEQGDLQTIKEGTREVNFALTFDQAPQVNKEAKIEDLELHFRNSNYRIKVNNDYLELGNIEDVTLKLRGFSGKVNFDHVGFSLDGIAKRIEVNGMAFSSQNGLSLSLNNVDYNYLFVDQIELKNIVLPAGNGKLEMADKLTYSLEQDHLTFYSFNGKIIVDRAASELVSMEGVTKGMSVSGSLLNLDVK